MTDLTVALRLTADASGLKAEVAQANASLGGLGAAAGAGAAGAAGPLRQTEEAARRAGASMRESAAGARAAGEQARITAQQMQQLTPQLTDFAVQVASGQGLFLPLIQQGPQVTQIFGGLRQTMVALVSAIGPANIALGLAAAAVGGLIAAGEGAERGLNALQNRLRATRDDYDGLALTARAAASAVAQSSQFSGGDARDAAAVLAGSGRFAGSQRDLEGLLRTAGDLSVVLGKTLPDAAGLLARAMEQPGGVARELAASGFRGFNPETARQIELLELAGGKGAAYAEVLRRVGEATAGAANNRTDLERALTDLGNAFDRLWDKAKPVAEVLARIAGAGAGAIADLLPGGTPPTGAGGAGGGAAATAQSSRVEDAVATALRLNPRLARRETNAATAAGLRAALADADPAQRRIIQDALRQLSADAAGLRGPGAEALAGLDDQAAIARRMPGADQAIFSAQLQFRRAMERDGGGASDAQLAEVAARVQRRLTEEAITYTDQLQLQAEGLDRVAGATLQGGRAAAATEARVRAEAEARRFSTVASGQHEQQVALLANAYMTLRDAEQAVRDAQAQADQRQQIELLEAQIAAVGGNVRERERELAVLRERQRIQREGGDPESAGGQARLANAGRAAELSRDLAERQEGYNTLARFGERAADRIGSAFTTAMLEGRDAFETLGNVGKAVLAELAQEFIKLALVSPIKNAIFGTAAPTIFSLYDGGAGAAAAATPVMGGLYHSGGIVGSEPTAMRSVPAAMFGAAPRFHSGLMPGEFPAILQQGEGVFTPQQMRALGPAGGSYSFAPTVYFNGDAGSASDRQQMLDQLRALWRADLAQAVPGILDAAQSRIVTDVHRRGSSRVFGEGAWQS